MAIGARFPQVLSAAAEGADWAWAEIYRDLSPGLLRFLTSQGASDPEDCLGECFIQVVRQLHDFTGEECDFRAWVFRIARSRLIDGWRRDQRRPARTSEDVSVAAERILQDVADAPSVRRAAVDEILAGLTPDQRAVLMLRYLQQFTLPEIAAVLGKNEGAIRVIQHRALAKLRRTLPGRMSELAAPAPRFAVPEVTPASSPVH